MHKQEMFRQFGNIMVYLHTKERIDRYLRMISTGEYQLCTNLRMEK